MKSKFNASSGLDVTQVAGVLAEMQDMSRINALLEQITAASESDLNAWQKAEKTLNALISFTQDVRNEAYKDLDMPALSQQQAFDLAAEGLAQDIGRARYLKMQLDAVAAEDLNPREAAARMLITVVGYVEGLRNDMGKPRTPCAVLAPGNDFVH